MARTEIDVEQVSINGLDDPSGDAGIADGHKFQNNGNVLLRIDNDDAAPHTVTFQTQQELEGFAVEDHDVTIAAASTEWYGPFKDIFNVRSGADRGMVYIDYEDSEEEHLTVTVFRI